VRVKWIFGNSFIFPLYLARGDQVVMAKVLG
jgi:hypothetical protein